MLRAVSSFLTTLLGDEYHPLLGERSKALPAQNVAQGDTLAWC